KRASMMDAKKDVDEWGKTLKLSDDQKKKIGEILSEDEPMKAVARDRIDLVLDAFPEKHFSMDELLPGSTAKEHAEEIATHIVMVTKKVAEVLTPEQRGIAAARLREKASGSGQETGTTTSGGGGGAGGSMGSTGAAESISGGEEVGSSAEALWAGAAGRYGA